MNAASLVVDASVLAKLFLAEADSTHADRSVRSVRSLFGPELLAVEVAAAIVRRFRMRGANRAETEASLAQARTFFTHGGIALAPDIDLLPRAELIAMELTHPLQDCLYLALAERLGCDLVTADATLLARAAPQFPFVKAL
ncbi:MAG: type II toxin-antitoxin system VapC family toxin [Hyphomonadaceae bacterium]|nr:type II toxin-antitoxin system VapC family toxin [Hyphomonadaceae bacterium]